MFEIGGGNAADIVQGVRGLAVPQQQTAQETKPPEVKVIIQQPDNDWIMITGMIIVPLVLGIGGWLVKRRYDRTHPRTKT